jgi:hypothetical protein
MSDSGRGMGAAFDDAAAEAMLTGRGDREDDLVAALLELGGAADRLAPDPSPALGELFARGLPIDELSHRRRGRLAIGVTVAGATTLALSGVAAAHDALPGPAQGVVTGIINGLTPFHITIGRPSLPAIPKPTDLAPGIGTPTPSGSPEEHQARTDDGRTRGDDGSGSDDRSGSGDDAGSGSDDGSDDRPRTESSSPGEGSESSDDGSDGSNGNESTSDNSGSDDGSSGSGSDSGGSDSSDGGSDDGIGSDN